MTVNIRSILLFQITAITLGILWSAYVVAHNLLQTPQSAGFSAWIAQLTVLIAALLAMSLSPTTFSGVGWTWGPFKAYAAVAIVTCLAVSAATALGYAFGGLRFEPQVTARQAWISLPILLTLSCMFAFAEELGWRGYLLPQLLPLGPRRALWLSGICWFIWELPLVMFGILDASLVHVSLPLAIMLHLMQTLSVGIALGYLRLRFRSIALPTFAHGLLNTLGGLSFFYVVETKPLVGDFAGFFGTAILVALAAALLARIPTQLDLA